MFSIDYLRLHWCMPNLLCTWKFSVSALCIIWETIWICATKWLCKASIDRNIVSYVSFDRQGYGEQHPFLAFDRPNNIWEIEWFLWRMALQNGTLLLIRVESRVEFISNKISYWTANLFTAIDSRLFKCIQFLKPNLFTRNLFLSL